MTLVPSIDESWAMTLNYSSFSIWFECNCWPYTNVGLFPMPGKWYTSLVTSIKDSQALSPSISVIYLIRVAMVYVAMAESEGFVIADSSWDMNWYRAQLITQIVRESITVKLQTHLLSPFFSCTPLNKLINAKLRIVNLENFVQFLNVKISFSIPTILDLTGSKSFYFDFPAVGACDAIWRYVPFGRNVVTLWFYWRHVKAF